MTAASVFSFERGENYTENICMLFQGSGKSSGYGLDGGWEGEGSGGEDWLWKIEFCDMVTTDVTTTGQAIIQVNDVTIRFKCRAGNVWTCVVISDNVWHCLEMSRKKTKS